MLTGALCILAGLARFGFVTDLLSKPIRYGYLNGIALTVLVGQLPKILGFSISGGNLIQEAKSLISGILNDKTNGTALVIGLACLLVIVGSKRWAPGIPGILVAVGGATIAVGWLPLQRQTGDRQPTRQDPEQARAETDKKRVEAVPSRQAHHLEDW